MYDALSMLLWVILLEPLFGPCEKPTLKSRLALIEDFTERSASVGLFEISKLFLVTEGEVRLLQVLFDL